MTILKILQFNSNFCPQDARSNRSFDSGLPDSSSTTSSTSPPGQAVTQAVEPSSSSSSSATRKSSSLDNVNLQQENKAQWKSFSLTRGAAPPSEEEAAHGDQQIIAMKTRAVEPRDQNGAGVGAMEQEEVYGRCTNMRLTSFTDKGAAVPRDPRLIDLSQSAASTGNLGHSGAGHGQPQPQHQQQFVSNCHTLPAHMPAHLSSQPHHAHPSHPGLVQPGAGQHPHNTLPARVTGGSEAGQQRNMHFHAAPLPSGRHFKPFDHRRINPMAEIQENPYEQQQQQVNGVYGGVPGAQYGGQENGHETYIVHHNNHIPHMPQELRHTNYGAGNKLINPQVLQHRDSGH